MMAVTVGKGEPLGNGGFPAVGRTVTCDRVGRTVSFDRMGLTVSCNRVGCTVSCDMGWVV